jgi:DNA polymerase kappa
MLEKLMKEIPDLKLRLMGLRVTQIISTKKPGIDFFGRAAKTSSTSSKASTSKNEGTWETWPEEEFEEAAQQERNDEMNELEKLSQEQGHQEEERSAPEPQWQCPICSISQPPDDASFNAHIDFCLSKQTIREVVKSTAPSPEKQSIAPKPITKKGKRGRPKNEGSISEQQAREKRRAFFSLGNSN